MTTIIENNSTKNNSGLHSVNTKLYGVKSLHYGYEFSIYAPFADEVYLTGDFNFWGDDLLMQKSNGVFKIVLKEDDLEFQKYKFKIKKGNDVYYKADPYALMKEDGGNGASLVFFGVDKFSWHDKGYMQYRASNANDKLTLPLNIYDVDISNFLNNADITYKYIAEELAPYLKEMGYTHIKLQLYRNTLSPFSINSEHGGCMSFLEMVDIFHMAGIGVITNGPDFCFSREEYGLSSFFKEGFYEDEKISNENFVFDITNDYVKSYLISNICLLLNKFHIDGICVDTDKYISYIDNALNNNIISGLEYSNRSNHYLKFLKMLNKTLKNKFCDAYLMSYPCRFESAYTYFDAVLNNDFTLHMSEYTEKDPIYRKYHHDMLLDTLSCCDDKCVVSDIDFDFCVFGNEKMQYATKKALAGYIMTLGNKKLTHMGNELLCDFKNKRFPDAYKDSGDISARFQLYISHLNRFYLENYNTLTKNKAKLICSDEEKSVIAYKKGDIYIALNFTPMLRDGYKINVDFGGEYKEIFSSDALEFCGDGTVNKNKIYAHAVKNMSMPYEINITLPPMGMCIFRKTKTQTF